eukprot:2447201-Pleurochrysis_carterae.AAC.1
MWECSCVQVHAHARAHGHMRTRGSISSLVRVSCVGGVREARPRAHLARSTRRRSTDIITVRGISPVGTASGLSWAVEDDGVAVTE